MWFFFLQTVWHGYLNSTADKMYLSISSCFKFQAAESTTVSQRQGPPRFPYAMKVSPCLQSYQPHIEPTGVTVSGEMTDFKKKQYRALAGGELF